MEQIFFTLFVHNTLPIIAPAKEIVGPRYMALCTNVVFDSHLRQMAHLGTCTHTNYISKQIIMGKMCGIISSITCLYFPYFPTYSRKRWMNV